MRILHKKEKEQRGCVYCYDVIQPSVAKSQGAKGQRACTYDECPYHELDGVKSYKEYMAKSNKIGLEKALEALG